MSAQDEIDKIEKKNVLDEWEVSRLRGKAKSLERAMKHIDVFAEMLDGRDFDLKKVNCHKFEEDDPAFADTICFYFKPYIGGSSFRVHIHYDDVDELCKKLQESLKDCRESDEEWARTQSNGD